MLIIGPSQYDRPDSPSWWVKANGELVATMSADADGRYWAHLDLHRATRAGKRVKHLRLDGFDTERLTRWARANEARLLRECPAPPPRPAYVDPCSVPFALAPPEPKEPRRSVRP